MRNCLRLLILVTVTFSLQGCAALWVADKAVDTAWFATKTTAKVGMTAAEVSWDAGSAAVDVAVGDDEEGEAKREKDSAKPADG